MQLPEPREVAEISVLHDRNAKKFLEQVKVTLLYLTDGEGWGYIRIELSMRGLLKDPQKGSISCN